jgi:hypothetical protein
LGDTHPTRSASPEIATGEALCAWRGGVYVIRMSELDDAVASLERAVARLEQVLDPARRAAEAETTAALATAVAERIDAALAKIGQLLEREK